MHVLHTCANIHVPVDHDITMKIQFYCIFHNVTMCKWLLHEIL